MLHVFISKDPVALRAAVHKHLDEVLGEESYERLSGESYMQGVLGEWAGAVDIFGGQRTVLLDMLSEHEEAHEELQNVALALAESPNRFVILDTDIAAPCAKELKKHAQSYKEITAKEGTERFNTFALADALTRKDKKSLWVLLLRARLAGVSTEEIVGTLFWQVKTMRLAAQTKSASEAGMKDFPYKKAKAGLKHFSEEELTDLSRALVRVYHEGHRGEDMDASLEQLILQI